MPRLTLCVSILFVSILALSVGALPGCGSSETESATSSAAGSWELDREVIRAAMQLEIDQIEDPMEKAGAGMMLSMLENLSMTIDLNPDGTCTGTMTMMGDTDESTGTWTLNDGVITITMVNADGEPEAMTGTLRGDRFELHDIDENSSMKMVFRRRTES